MHHKYQWKDCICNRMESCTIGFLQRNDIRCKRDNLRGQFGQISELYKYSDCEISHRISTRNKGIASFCLFSDTQE